MILVQGYQIITTNKGSSELTMAALETFIMWQNCFELVCSTNQSYQMTTALPEHVMKFAWSELSVK